MVVTKTEIPWEKQLSINRLARDTKMTARDLL
jgi:hypothetical protein